MQRNSPSLSPCTFILIALEDLKGHSFFAEDLCEGETAETGPSNEDVGIRSLSHNFNRGNKIYVGMKGGIEVSWKLLGIMISLL